MKKLILIFTAVLFFVSCDEIPNDVIDVEEADYQIVKIESPSLIVLTQEETELVTSLQLSTSENIEKVTAQILSIDGRYTLSSGKELKDDGTAPDENSNDLIYTTSFVLTEEIPTDNYIIEFFVTSLGEQKKAAVKNFRYDNGTSNIPPVLSDVIAPDSLTVADTTAFAVSVKVYDENGLNDIKSVYFFVTRPDGVSSGVPTFLFDDGSLTGNGDETPGDGRYSRIIVINQSNQKGIYKLEFQAEDKGNKKSEILTHNFLVK